jgi:hypothetical protein
MSGDLELNGRRALVTGGMQESPGFLRRCAEGRCHFFE